MLFSALNIFWKGAIEKLHIIIITSAIGIHPKKYLTTLWRMDIVFCQEMMSFNWASPTKPCAFVYFNLMIIFCLIYMNTGFPLDFKVCTKINPKCALI